MIVVVVELIVIVVEIIMLQEDVLFPVLALALVLVIVMLQDVTNDVMIVEMTAITITVVMNPDVIVTNTVQLVVPYPLVIKANEF